MIDYRETLQKELKDPAFKQAWDSFELEYNLADLVIIGNRQNGKRESRPQAGEPGKDRFRLRKEA